MTATWADVAENPAVLATVSDEIFLDAAAYVLGARGYDLGQWKPMEDGGGFHGVALNLQTELFAAIYCHVGDAPLTMEALRQVRTQLYQEPRFHVLTIVSRHDLPPSLILSPAIGCPTEPIGQSTIARWARAITQNKVQDLISEYMTTIMTTGTIGLESHALGSLLLPHAAGFDGQGLAARLHIPPEYTARLQATRFLSLDALQRIQKDPRAMRALTPREFEEFTAELLSRLGFRDIQLTPRSDDGGRDVIALKEVDGIPLCFFFECKKYAEGNKVQLDTLRALLGVVAHESRTANIGVLVTTSRFTSGCTQLLASECRLDGKDYSGILRWLQKLDSFNGKN